MFTKNYQTAFGLTLMTGTFIAISSNSWLTAWIGLEINLLSMIPLILSKLNQNLTEAAIKYFLAQAMASIVLILGAALDLSSFNHLSPETSNLLMTMAIMMKAGLAPLHFWFPQMSPCLSWSQCLILFTWQKVAPLLLLVTINSYMVYVTTALSAVTGALGGMNQTNLKLMLSYSSISHSAWMIIAAIGSFYYWEAYFLVYFILSVSIISYFNCNNTVTVSNIYNNSDSYINKMALIINLMSLGGLPPFLGFTVKMSVIVLAIKMNSIVVLIPLILSSLVSLYFYMRMIYVSLMNETTTIKIKKMNNTKNMTISTAITSGLNILTPVFFILN